MTRRRRSCGLLFLLFLIIAEIQCASDKVRLTDVRALTLHRGKWTTGRRAAATEQLRCVGGSAKGAFTPRVVQCVNQGFDGNDVQWRCDADLPHNMEFGRITVSCEGYDYPDDPYVLKGSCGLEYELEYNSNSGSRSVGHKKDSWDSFGTMVVILFIAFVAYSMYNNWGANGYNGGGGPGGPGGGGGGGGYPGGYPGAPPPYDDHSSYQKPPPYGFSTGANQGSGSGTANNQGGGGFWSGAGLGALGGYLASNWLNNGYNGYGYARQRRGYGGYGGYGFNDNSDSFFSGPSTSSDTRSASGYGGTSRR